MKRAGCSVGYFVPLYSLMSWGPNNGAPGLESLVLTFLKDLEGPIWNLALFYIAASTPRISDDDPRRWICGSKCDGHLLRVSNIGARKVRPLTVCFDGRLPP